MIAPSWFFDLTYSSVSRYPSTIVATSERRTSFPRKFVIGMSANSPALLISDGILTEKSFVPILMLPPGILTFSALRMVDNCAIER